MLNILEKLAERFELFNRKNSPSARADCVSAGTFQQAGRDIVNASDARDRPSVDVVNGLGSSGGPDGVTITVEVRNTGKADAIDVKWFLAADDVRQPLDSLLPTPVAHRLTQGEKSNPQTYNYTDTIFFKQKLRNPRIVLLYQDIKGQMYRSERAIIQRERADGNFNISGEPGPFRERESENVGWLWSREKVTPVPKLDGKGNDIPSAHEPLSSLQNVSLIASVATILGVGWAVYIYFVPSNAPIVTITNNDQLSRESDSERLATSTLNVADLLEKALKLETVLERQDFLQKYIGAKIVGKGVVDQISRSGTSGYLVDVKILGALLTCPIEYSEENERKLPLLQGKIISFSGVFSYRNIFDHGLAIDQCRLLNL